jgi:hypothetical protein
MPYMAMGKRGRTPGSSAGQIIDACSTNDAVDYPGFDRTSPRGSISTRRRSLVRAQHRPLAYLQGFAAQVTSAYTVATLGLS